MNNVLDCSKKNLRFHLILLTLVGCGALMLAGCQTTETGPDAWWSQPYYGGPHVAGVNVKVTIGIPFKSHGEVTWGHPNSAGSRTKGSRVARKVIKYLEESGISLEEVPLEPKEEWHSFVRKANLNKLSMTHVGAAIFQNTIVICSIDPIIVVIASKPIGTIYWDDSNNGGLAKVLTPELIQGRNLDESALIVGLPGGIVYGQQVPYAEGLMWASPDLKVGPKPVEFGEDGDGRIPVPWGELKLTLKDDMYNVSARTNP